jgi:hypothetical protein
MTDANARLLADLRAVSPGAAARIEAVLAQIAQVRRLYLVSAGGKIEHRQAVLIVNAAQKNTGKDVQ